MTTPGLVLTGLSSGSGQLDILDDLCSHLDISHTIACFSAGMVVPGFRLLDPVMCGVETTVDLYTEASQGADVAVIIGPGGLFDAPQLPGDHTSMSDTAPASPAHLAVLLGLPVVLVVDVTGMFQTVGAVIKGVTMMDPEVRIQGVILTGYATATHREMCRVAVEAQGVWVVDSMDEIVQLAEHPTAGDNVAGTGGDKPGVDKCPGDPVVALNTGASPEWQDVLGALGACVVDFDPLTEDIPACDGLIIDGATAPDLERYVASTRPLYVQGPAAWQVAHQLGVDADAGANEPGLYREAVSLTGSVMFPAGQRVVGVDTAGAILTEAAGWDPVWAWRSNDGQVVREGFHRGNIAATALRIHPAAVIRTAAIAGFLAACTH